LRYLREGGMYGRFHNRFARLFQKKTHHLWIELLKDGNGRSRIVLDRQEECFGGQVGTHNRRDYIIQSKNPARKPSRLDEDSTRNVPLRRYVKFLAHPDRIHGHGY